MDGSNIALIILILFVMYIIVMGVFYSDEKFKKEQLVKEELTESNLKERKDSMEVKEGILHHYAKDFLERYFNTSFIYEEDKQKLIQLCKDQGFYEKDVLDKEPKKFLRELLRTIPEYHKYLWNNYAFVLYEDTGIPKREKEHYGQGKLRRRLREPLACDALYNTLEKSELALHKQDLIYYYAVLNFCKGGWRTELRYNLDIMALLEARLNKLTLTNKDFKYLINKTKEAKVFIVRTSEHESNILGFIKFLHKLPKEKGFSYDYITLSTLHHFELNDNTEEIIDSVINKEPKESIKTNTLMYLWIKINEQPLVKGDKYDSFLSGFFVPNNFDVDLIKVLNKVHVRFQEKFHRFELNFTEQELLTFTYANGMNRVQQYKFLEYIEKVFGTKMNQDIKSVLFKNINQLDLRSYKHEKREIKTEDIKIDFA